MLEESTKTTDEITIVVTDLASATRDEDKQDIGVDNRTDNETETVTGG